MITAPGILVRSGYTNADDSQVKGCSERGNESHGGHEHALFHHGDKLGLC